MGYQRYIAEGLMEQFALTEAEAFDKVKFVECFMSVGDELSDVIYLHLDEEGDIEETAKGLREIRDELTNHILNFEAAFVGVKRRRA